MSARRMRICLGGVRYQWREFAQRYCYCTVTSFYFTTQRLRCRIHRFVTNHSRPAADNGVPKLRCFSDRPLIQRRLKKNTQHSRVQESNMAIKHPLYKVFHFQHHLQKGEGSSTPCLIYQRVSWIVFPNLTILHSRCAQKPTTSEHSLFILFPSHIKYHPSYGPEMKWHDPTLNRDFLSWLFILC